MQRNSGKTIAALLLVPFIVMTTVITAGCGANAQKGSGKLSCSSQTKASIHLQATALFQSLNALILRSR